MECGVLLIVPVVLLVWVASATAGVVSWTVDASGFSVQRGDRVTRFIPWGEVRSIRAWGKGPVTAWVKIVDRAGRTRANLIAGPVFGFDDIKTLYEAGAYHSRSFGVATPNNLGWRPNLPMMGTREAVGDRPDVWPHVAGSLMVAGLFILATGAFEGVAAPIFFGLGLVAIAIALLFVDRTRSKKRRRTRKGST